MTYSCRYNSPLGGMTLVSDGYALTGLWFDGQKYVDSAVLLNCTNGKLPVFEQTVRWLDMYFGGKSPDFIPPLSTTSSPFRKEVWDILLTIPFGKTATYGEIASIMARRRGLIKMSAQAVGGAVGHNPIAIIIPCHRVVGYGGNLTGYAGGLDRKRKLLELEGVDTSFFFVPEAR